MENKTNSDGKANFNLADQILGGPILPISMQMAMPILIGQLLLLLYAIVDTFFISLINKNSTSLISGVGLVFPVYMLFLSLGIGLYTGVSSLVARGVGEKNQVVLDKSADSGLFVSAITAIITVVVLYIVGKPIIHFLAGGGLSEEAINNGLQYFYYIIPGLGLLLIYESMLGVLQGEGLSQFYGISMMISTVVNIILDPLFIFGFKMGVAGAALATSISILVSLLLVTFVFIPKNASIKIKWNIFNADKRLVSEIFRIGIPQVLSMIALSITMMFLNNLVSSISEKAMNSWALVGRMDEFLLMVGYAFGSATLTLVGQNYGNKNFPRVSEVYKTNIVAGLVMAAIFAVIYNVFARNIFGMFSAVPDVVNGSVAQVRVISFTYLGIIIAIISTSAFQGTGKALPGLILDIIRMGIFTIPAAFLIVYSFNQGVTGIFYVVGAANLLAGILSFLWCSMHLKKLKFKNIVS